MYPGASTEGGVDAACVQFGSGGKEFCRQGGKCPERLRYMRGGREGGIASTTCGGIDAPGFLLVIKFFAHFSLGDTVAEHMYF
jgi:hypothetical protein